jgi:hypothetical protein
MEMGLGRLKQSSTTPQAFRPHRPFLSQPTVDSVSMTLHSLVSLDEMTKYRISVTLIAFASGQSNFSKQILEGKNK